MQKLERRITRRLIMKVPLKFRPVQAPGGSEKDAASMNICNQGVYFATDEKIHKGGMVQIHLKLPREVVGDDVAEWCFTGRVAHVELLGAQNDKIGSGRSVPLLRDSSTFHLGVRPITRRPLLASIKR